MKREQRQVLLEATLIKKVIASLNNENINKWINFSSAFKKASKALNCYLNVTTYPAIENVFRAFSELPVANLKVVILGQDPYHDGSATGLAFDNSLNDKISPSLKNILTQLEEYRKENDYERGANRETHLEHLPKQGVLLLNTALTVEKGKPNSHKEQWQEFTENIIVDINGYKDDIVWILWGNNAKTYKKFITNDTHKVIEGTHPSPLAHRNKNTQHPFFKINYFDETNKILEAKGKNKILW